MSAPAPDVVRALEALFDRVLASGPLWTEYDAAWRSPCETGPPTDDGRVGWRPVRRDAWDLLDPLAATLETPIHPALASYYGSHFFDGLEVQAPQGPVSLIGVWNEDDGQRLLQNLLGHALQQRRQRAPDSLFFACTEADSELILTLDNASGEVLLERPGTRRAEVVAADLAAFLDSLRPAD